jgi:hypothetical protein
LLLFMLAAPPVVLVLAPELPVVVSLLALLTFFFFVILFCASIGLFDFICESWPPAGPVVWAKAALSGVALMSAAAQVATISFFMVWSPLVETRAPTGTLNSPCDNLFLPDVRIFV